MGSRESRRRNRARDVAGRLAGAERRRADGEDVVVGHPPSDPTDSDHFDEGMVVAECEHVELELAVIVGKQLEEVHRIRRCEAYLGARAPVPTPVAQQGEAGDLDDHVPMRPLGRWDDLPPSSVSVGGRCSAAQAAVAEGIVH